MCCSCRCQYGERMSSLEPIKSSWLLVFYACVGKIPPVSNCPAFPHADRAVSPHRRNVFKVLQSRRPEESLRVKPSVKVNQRNLNIFD